MLIMIVCTAERCQRYRLQGPYGSHTEGAFRRISVSKMIYTAFVSPRRERRRTFETVGIETMFILLGAWVLWNGYANRVVDDRMAEVTGQLGNRRYENTTAVASF